MKLQDQHRLDGIDSGGAPYLISRRNAISTLAAVGAIAPVLGLGVAPGHPEPTDFLSVQSRDESTTAGAAAMTDTITSEKIRRARLSGPSIVTTNATVAEMDAQGQLHVLSKGTNEWVCCPGNENIIGDVPMALDPMGMQWLMDLHARKPKPTNTAPGLIYMLCGAIQHSYTDPFDRTSPPIPIGPHWMLLWPFDAKAAGMGTVMRDAGTMVMFAGTPYAHLHICGSPWDGNEYHPDDRIIRTLTYVRPR